MVGNSNQEKIERNPDLVRFKRDYGVDRLEDNDEISINVDSDLVFVEPVLI